MITFVSLNKCLLFTKSLPLLRVGVSDPQLHTPTHIMPPPPPGVLLLLLLLLLKYLILPDWALHQGIRWCGLFMIKCCVHICTVLVKNLAWCNYIWGSWTSASLCLKQFTEGDVTMLSESWFHSGMVRWMNAYL